jgi:hypothetical protein
MIARVGVFYGRRGVARPKWYVDSVLGDDANRGDRPGSALRTIAALQARIGAGDRVGLARGSVWREQLSLPAARVEVVAYGSGDKPLLDCSDPIGAAAWSQASGYQNVYQCTVPVDGAGWASLWEGDVRLRRAASMADLETAAGRYLPAADPAGAGGLTLYVHPSDGTNPGTNGKKYEYARREYGLFTDCPQCKVTGIHTRRNLGGNGSLEVAPDSALVNCLASEGTKHNILVHGNCTVTGCEMADSYFDGQSKVMAVWNADSPSGEDVTFVNCYAHDEFEGTAVGFYGHRNVSGSFGRITLRGCRSDHVLAGFPAVGECREVLIEDSDLWVVGCAVDTTIRNSIVRGNLRCLNTVGGPVVTIRNCRIVANYTALDGADAVVYSPYPGATLDMQNSSVEGSLKDGPDLMVNGLWMDGTNTTLVSHHNTFVNLAHYYMFDAEGYKVDSDDNVFEEPILASSFRLPGWQWKTIAQWREITGQDLHSTP